MIDVTFINNDGAGFADVIPVDDGTTAVELFDQQLPNSDPGAYLIRVNKKACASTCVLVDGDTMTATPTKIDGAGGWTNS